MDRKKKESNGRHGPLYLSAEAVRHGNYLENISKRDITQIFNHYKFYSRKKKHAFYLHSANNGDLKAFQSGLHTHALHTRMARLSTTGWFSWMQ